MQLLGIDLSDRTLRAVVLDEKGGVARRLNGPVAQAGALLGEAGPGPFHAVGLSVDPEVPVPDLPILRQAHRSRPGSSAVVAEAWVGAARGAQHAVCLSIGERVLAGILLEGRTWAGAHGLAGSAAWLALNPVERQDYRKFGSLAAEVSSKGIARRLAWRIQAGDHSAVLERAGDLESITAEHVFDGARTNDGVSISVVRDTAKYIGMAVANLASTIDPDVVVLAGAIAAAGDLLLDPVRQECGRRLPPALSDSFRLEISPLGDDGVAIGAARLAALARA